MSGTVAAWLLTTIPIAIGVWDCRRQERRRRRRRERVALVHSAKERAANRRPVAALGGYLAGGER